MIRRIELIINEREIKILEKVLYYCRLLHKL
nr:MAG TPA: hypothetical protein [Caudoviricetes sp.]